MRDRKSNFVIFVIWSALCTDEWVLVACSRKSCLGPAEFGSFMCLVLFKHGGRSVGRRFHLFVSDVNLFVSEIRLRIQGEFKISLHDPRNGKTPLRSFTSCLKIEYVLWKWDEGQYLDRDCVEFVTAV